METTVWMSGEGFGEHGETQELPLPERDKAELRRIFEFGVNVPDGTRQEIHITIVHE